MKPGALSIALRVGAALAAAALTALLTVSGASWRLDDFLYDLHLSHWGYPPDGDVVVVAIDDRSLNELGQWPWPRDIHAQMFDRLGYAGVRGVALDLVLAEPDRNGDERDRTLAAAMRRLGRVALPVVTAPLRQNAPPEEVLPTPAIAAAAPTTPAIAGTPSAPRPPATAPPATASRTNARIVPPRRIHGQFTQSPSNASSAGSSVIDASTATTTAIADAWPSTVISETPDTASESRAITTVMPANATALPDVAAAWPIASWVLMPSWRAERARVTMNSE